MKKIHAFGSLICLVVILIFSCELPTDYQMPSTDSKDKTVKTTVSGIVLDESNAPMSGVTVTASGKTTTTNQYGTFVVKNFYANEKRCLLHFSKAGFFDRAHGCVVTANTVNYVQIVLISNASSQNFTASAGGTVSLPDGSSTVFQPNSLVTADGHPYSGTVNIAFKHLSPDDPNFGFTIPGGDLAGKDANDKDVSLYSFGMLGVQLTGGSNEALQLAAGTNAQLKFPVAASQSSIASATIPLWYFDEATSLWKEEGLATRTGNNYTASVAHFSWWNCDYSGTRAFLKGKVTDCRGNPLVNIIVSLNGRAGICTNQNGEYNDWTIANSGIPVRMQVLPNYWSWYTASQVENVPVLSANQTYIVPDLVIACPSKIKGNLKNCSGENIDGIVYITNHANFSTFQYTVNSVFNLSVIGGTQLDVIASNEPKFSQMTVTSPGAPNELNLGDILLCGSSTITLALEDIPENDIAINCPGFGWTDTIIHYDSLSNYGVSDTTWGLTSIWVGPSSNHHHYEMHLYTLAPGTFHWDNITNYNMFHGLFSLVCFGCINVNYNSSSPADTGTIHLNYIGNTNERISGDFNGHVTFTKGGITMPGTIKGRFNVKRAP